MWLSSFLRTRRQRPCAAILIHSTRSARPPSGCTNRFNSRDVPTLVRSAMQKASVSGHAMRVSSKTYCILPFQIQRSPRGELHLETINIKVKERAFGLSLQDAAQAEKRGPAQQPRNPLKSSTPLFPAR